jgi:hypothetical protein
LHHGVPPDYLHTFVKGCIEYCLALVMAIVYSVQKLDGQRYSSNVSTLDRRIELASIDQTLYATRMSKFNRGISVFFSHENSKTTRNTGLMTGNLPAWKLKPLLILLQISIGEDEAILPKSSRWCSERCPGKVSKSWAILTTVHHAMSSTLEVMFALSKKQATLSELGRLDYLIHLNNLHLLRLKLLSNELLYACTGNKKAEGTPLYSGIKLHMMTHFAYYKFFYGMPTFLTDMELPEHSHLKSKYAFEHTTKTYTDNISEMAVYQVRRSHAERMNARAIESIKDPQQLDCETKLTHGFEFYSSSKIGFSSFDLLLFDNNEFSYAPKSKKCGLHYLLSLKTLKIYLLHYAKHSEDHSAEALSLLFDVDERYDYDCKLLHNINVSSNVDIPLEGFILHANKLRRCNSNQKSSSSTSPTFSFFEVEYVDQNSLQVSSFVVVRLMAIFEINISDSHRRRQGTHQLAIVCKMTAVSKDRNCVMPEPFVKLRYGMNSFNELDIDIVEFTSLHMPACVFECSSNATNESTTNFQNSVFYQIPSSRIVTTEPVGSLEDILQSSDPMILNVGELNSELVSYQSVEPVVEVEQESDNIEEKDDHDLDDNETDNDNYIN